MNMILTIFFYLWIPIVLAGYLGFVSRWHGGGFFSGWKVIKNLLWGMPFGLIAGWFFLIYRWPSVQTIWFLTETFGKNLKLYEHAFWAVPLSISLIVWGLSYLAKATGHGGGFDLAHNAMELGRGRKAEKLEYLIIGLHGQIGQYVYDVILMAVIGLFSTLPAALALGYIYAPAGYILLLGGIFKAPAYMIGWKYYFPVDEGSRNVDFREPTQIGEWLSGVGAGLSLGGAYILVLVWVFTNA